MENSKSLKKGMEIEVREIVFSNDEEGRSFCDIFVYEPENIDEQILGNLYIIGEITNVSENSSYLVNLLASIIKKEFYSNTKRTAIESLETGLHRANGTLSDIAEQGNIDWVGNLNMICAVYSGDELHLSQAGNCKTLLIRNGQITNIGKNVIEKEKTHPFRTFANIASGELEIEDIALFATPGFFNIFSLEKLRKLSSSPNLDEFVEKLQNSIEQEKNLDTVGSLIMKIKNSEQKENKLSHLKIEPPTEEACEDEKETAPIFQERSEETNKKIKEWAEKKPSEENDDIFKEETSVNDQKISLKNIIEEYERKEEKTDPDTAKIVSEEQKKEKGVSLDDLIEKNSYPEEEIKKEEIKKEEPKKNIFIKSLKSLNSILVKFIASLLSRAKKTNSDISEKTSPETELKPSQRAKLIPVKNKYLLIVFMLVATILVWSIVSTNYQKEEDGKFEKYTNVLSQAENEISKIESIVIYGDFEEARNLLADIKNSVLEVRNEYDKLDGEAGVLLEKIQVQFDKVDLVNRITAPKIMIDLSQAGELKNAGEIIKIGKEYYVSDLSNNSLFQIDFENNKADRAQTETSADPGQFKFSTAMTKTNEIIFLTDSNKIAVFNTSERELLAKNIEFSNDISNAKDIASYSSYLYLLKSDSNQIYKHTRSTSGFSKGQIWIKDPEADIRNAISLAIDGSIYILMSDGSVDKYLRGNKFKASDQSDFSIDELGDPISSPTEIYTRSGLEYLYILEPQKNRIVLFDKISGKLFRQYTSESFNDLKNIV
ncbi:MAG: hypothetical protein U9N04_04160, partial [Patescibacteria group bacterium]|nr:hypothetical protein [Patescibacteria group bacterium]